MTDGTSRPLGESERIDCLRLSRSENVGPVTYRQMMRHYGSARAALAAIPELARRGGRGRTIRICSRAQAEREIAALAACGARLIALGEPDYPVPLAAIEDAPPLIAIKGHVHLLARPAVAIVGARNASANGRRFARRLAGALGGVATAGGDLVIVSGLARGIDAEAHLGAVETGTVAVVAGGVDVAYPEENTALQERIGAEGAIVSEQPPGTVPHGRHFPRRNRLISGLSRGVIVVEAAPRSGSLITARLALEQGREVFAVPGSPLDPRCRGTNHLIRQGATLTEGVEDVLDVLETLLRTPLAEPGDADYGTPPPSPPDDTRFDAARTAICEALGPSPVPVDELVRGTDASPAVVAMILLELELAGRLHRHPGGQVSLAMG